MGYYSPLRYPGGKSKLAGFMKLVFEQNNLLDGHYAEPYAGGAGVAIELLLEGFASHIHINDIDPGISAFWNAVVNHPDELCRLISKTSLSVYQWKRQRKIQKSITDPRSVELGFSTLYLNRTNYSGIINGGIIGGLDQTGNYKLDARFNRKDLITRIEKIAFLADRIHLSSQDALLFITRMNAELPGRSLIYLDPPYYIKGGDLYRNFYKYEDHANVAMSIRNLTCKWIVSYDNVEPINCLFHGYHRKVYDLNYCAAGATVGSEVMFFCNELIVPAVDNPARIYAA